MLPAEILRGRVWQLFRRVGLWRFDLDPVFFRFAPTAAQSAITPSVPAS